MNTGACLKAPAGALAVVLASILYLVLDLVLAIPVLDLPCMTVLVHPGHATLGTPSQQSRVVSESGAGRWPGLKVCYGL